MHSCIYTIHIYIEFCKRWPASMYLYNLTILYMYIDVLFCNLYSSFCTQLYFHPMCRALQKTGKRVEMLIIKKTKIGRSVFLEIVKDPMTRFKGPKGSSLGSMVQIYFLRLIDLHSTHLKYLKKNLQIQFFLFQPQFAIFRIHSILLSQFYHLLKTSFFCSYLILFGWKFEPIYSAVKHEILYQNLLVVRWDWSIGERIGITFTYVMWRLLRLQSEKCVNLNVANSKVQKRKNCRMINASEKERVSAYTCHVAFAEAAFPVPMT